MNILEKDLEEIIEKTPTLQLQERGLDVDGICKRQLKIGNYGIADLVYIKKDYDYAFKDNKMQLKPFLNINICELKKDKAGISAFLQAVRYAKGISYYLDKRNFNNYKMQITLIAPNIDTQSDFIFLSDLILSSQNGFISTISNYSVKYNFDGIEFKHETNYSLTDNGF